MGCRVCSHEDRDEIEATAGMPGADLFQLAERYRVTAAALAKHATHTPAAPTPTTSPRPKLGGLNPARGGRRPAQQAPTKAPPRGGVSANGTEKEADEEAPATSRSDEIRARAPSHPRATARDKVERLVDSIQALIDDVQSDDDAPLGAKITCLRAMTGPLRLLGTLTGELGASEGTLASSPFYRRVRTALVEALRPFPEAALAVATALERAERGGADLEAAAE